MSTMVDTDVNKWKPTSGKYRKIDARLYSQILEAFRVYPGNYTKVSQSVPCNYRTARKAWVEGFPESPATAKPIRDLFAEEALGRRAAVAALEVERIRAEQTRAEVEQVHDDVVTMRDEIEREEKAAVVLAQKALAATSAGDSHLAEAQMVEKARTGAISLWDTVSSISKSLEALNQKIDGSIRELANVVDDEGNPRELTPRELGYTLKLLNQVSNAFKSVTDASTRIMQMERLLLGEPTKIVSHLVHHDIDVADAQARLEAAQRAFDRSQAAKQIIDAQLEPEPEEPAIVLDDVDETNTQKT